MTGFVMDNARYLPCFLTEAGVETLSPGANTIAEIRDRELKGKMMRVQEIALDANADITARIRENNRSLEESNALNLDNSARFDLHIRTLYYLNLYNNLAVPVSNFAYRYGFVLKKMTIADKIFYGIHLNSEEEGISEEYDIKMLVEEGSLPLPLETFLLRAFKKSTTRTVSFHGDLTTSGSDVGSEVSSVGKILILEGISMEKPPTGAYTTRMDITCDETHFHSIRAWACSGSLFDLKFFIPCKDSFALRLETNTGIAAYDCRYCYSEAKLTPFLKMLFGMTMRDENEDLWRRCVSGVGPL